MALNLATFRRWPCPIIAIRWIGRIDDRDRWSGAGTAMSRIEFQGVSKYFGGTPRTGVTRDEKAAAVAQIRRRGC